MLLLLPVVILLIASTYVLTRGLEPRVKLWVRALLAILILGPSGYLLFSIRDPAPPGSIELTDEDMQKAAPAIPK
jgi:hypothetical protein